MVYLNDGRCISSQYDKGIATDRLLGSSSSLVLLSQLFCSQSPHQNNLAQLKLHENSFLIAFSVWNPTPEGSFETNFGGNAGQNFLTF